jgi:hypothetical protein
MTTYARSAANATLTTPAAEQRSINMLL